MEYIYRGLPDFETIGHLNDEKFYAFSDRIQAILWVKWI